MTREGESGQVHESLPQVVQGSSGWRVGRTLEPAGFVRSLER